MRKKTVVAASVLAAGLVAAQASPSWAAEPEPPPYPVWCLHVILPGGVPLPVICVPYPL